MKFIVDSIKHIMYCVIGCSIYHVTDYFFGITHFIFKLLGLGF